jgi:hypothetical protein
MFLISELKNQSGELIAVITVPSKEFKTGSKGFFASSKAEIDGKKYQIQIQVVEIGSKKSTEEKAEN